MSSRLISAAQLADNNTRPESTGHWDCIDHAYCLTLSTRSDRQKEAIEELRKAGLMGKTTFVVSDPTDGPKPPAIFESHCVAARDAASKGFRKILIMEDDVCFLRSGDEVLTKVRRSLKQLPNQWQGLYLGHFPVRAYFVACGLLRTSSGCSHAYIANEPLIRWLADINPVADLPGQRIPLLRVVGQGIDAALARRPGMYACFPMVAVQSRSPSSNINPQLARNGKPRGLLDKYRYTHLAIRSMRVAEWIAATLSPWHWIRRNRWLPEETV